MRPLTYLVVAGSLLLTACASQGPGTGAENRGRRYGDAVERRWQSARHLQAEGDLAAAAMQLELLTLLVPKDASFQQELNSVRTAIARSVTADYDKGVAALKKGDSDEAMHRMLRVLALDPGHRRAARVLRDIEAARIGRIQEVRAQRARRSDAYAKSQHDTNAAETPDSPRSYDLEQAIELFTAGDAEGGLRELQRYVAANPGDKAGRRRIADIVFTRARKLDNGATRAQALVMYERAIEFRGAQVPAWKARLTTTRRKLANDYYKKGMRAYADNLDLAIDYWRTCLKYNPQQVNCGLRLKATESLRKKLKKLEAGDGGG